MRVGLTYDLKDDYLALGLSKEACAEFDSIETIDAIDTFLTSRGMKTERIGNIQTLTRALASGKTLGPGVQYRRRALRTRARGAGARFA